MLVFALIITALIGFLVVFVAAGLVIRKISYVLRTKREAALDDIYLHKLNPLLLEEPPPGIPDRDSLLFRQHCQKIFEPMRSELSRLGYLKRRVHRAALKRVALGMSAELVGETRSRLTLAFKIFGFVDEELKNIRSRRWWIRANSCRNLALMLAEEATADFGILLKDDEQDVRTEAAIALLTISGVTALSRLFTELESVTIWMSLQLSRCILPMGSRAVPYLVEGLNSGQQGIRRFCTEMLGSIGDIAACEPLIATARTRDTGLRSKALLAIGKLGDERGKDTLLEGLSDEDEECRTSAALGLGYLGSPDTSEQLKDHLLRDTIAVRLASGKSLARMEDWGRGILIRAFREADSIGKTIIQQFLDEVGADGQRLEGETQ